MASSGLCILVYIQPILGVSPKTKRKEKPPTSFLPCACLEDVYCERSLVYMIIFQSPDEVKTDGYPSQWIQAVKAAELHHDSAAWSQEPLLPFLHSSIQSPPTAALLIMKLNVRHYWGNFNERVHFQNTVHLFWKHEESLVIYLLRSLKFSLFLFCQARAQVAHYPFKKCHNVLISCS